MLAFLLLSCHTTPEWRPALDIDPPASSTVLSLDWGTATTDADGTVTLARDSLYETTDAFLTGGVGLAMLDAADGSGTTLRTDEGEVSWEEVEGEVSLVAAFEDAPDLRWRWSVAQEELVVQLGVENDTDDTVLVAKLAPLRVDADDGGAFWVGGDPTRHRILENGSHAALDFVVDVVPGDVEVNEAYALLSPGEYEGASVSNWNHAVGDLDGDAVWVAGALSFDRSVPVLNLSYDAGDSVEKDGGERSFTFLSLEADQLPDPVPVAPGEILWSERFVLIPDRATVQEGAEHYAEVLAAELGVVPWHRRNEFRRVPNGWNSWSGSGGTGGYGTGLDEALFLENLDWTARELRDWGMEWFQFDDGYEPFYGDWTWRSDRFPSGARGLSDAIRERGMRPGIWIAAFTADPNSTLVAEHPDWFAQKTDLGRIVVGDTWILDLSHPEVQQWLSELGTEIVDEWGFDWVKLDFGYQALFGQDFWQEGATREEAWRDGLFAFREALGPQTFLLLVGIVGIDYDLVDSARVTLDNAPVWEWEPRLDADDTLEQQGIKPTLRTAGRRWYLQDRVWVNHPDLIIFRSNTIDTDWPEVSFAEARSFATWVGLSGGIVKLGDRLVEMTGPQVDVVRRLLPVHPVAATPVDVLEREFPQVWRKTVDGGEDGYRGTFHLVGLFDWGANRDLTTSPYAEIPDDPDGRRLTVDLSDLPGDRWLAYEFWTGSFLGLVQDTLVVDVPVHDSRVVALHAPTGAPQWLGWNRQLTMGGVLLEDAAWDGTAFTVRTPVVPGTELAPFSWELAIYVPDGFTVGEARAEGVTLHDLTLTQEGQLLRVRFAPAAMGDLVLTIPMSR